jgi:2-polyprenyl-6-methoxyphenol hydroxylase-like FAD-dependent oxidoreductase
MQAVESTFVPEPDSIKCSQLHGPRTVLIGDAAHCAAPVLGQGANAALEDVSVLVNTLRRMHDLRRSAAASGIEHAMHDVAAFTRARKHDVHALIDLNRCVL